MAADEVWVVETHRGHGESARVFGVFEDREAAFEALKAAAPGITVWVDEHGMVRARPRDESWPNMNRLWAWGHPMEVQGRVAAEITR